MHTRRYLVLGDQGGGKTSRSADLIDEFDRQNRTGRLVVVSTNPPRMNGVDDPLAARCNRSFELTDALAQRGVDWPRLLDEEPRLYVELSVVTYPAECLGELAAELMRRGNALVVFDEAYRTVPIGADWRLLDLWANGRKHGIDCIAVSASAMQRKEQSVSPVVFDQSDTLVVFNIASPTVRDKIAERAPAIAPHLETLATPRDGGAPEFAVAKLGPNPEFELVTRAGARPA